MLCNNPGGGWLEGSIRPTVQGNQGFSLWGLARCSASYTCKISSVIISHVPRPLRLLVLARTIDRTYYTIRFFFSASNLLFSTTRGITSQFGAWRSSEQTVCAPQDRCEIATSDYTATGARVFVFAPPRLSCFLSTDMLIWGCTHMLLEDDDDDEGPRSHSNQYAVL